MNTLEHMRKLVEDLSRMKEGSLFEVIDTMREGADALADALGLLRKCRSWIQGAYVGTPHVLQPLLDQIDALASPSEGNKKGDGPDRPYSETGNYDDDAMLRPQEQPRKATGKPSIADDRRSMKIGSLVQQLRGIARGFAEQSNAWCADVLFRAANELANSAVVSVSPAAAEGWQMERVSALTDALRTLAPMAKNDAMMLESLSRHQPVPGTETAEFGETADKAMQAVNDAYVLIGLEPPFATAAPPSPAAPEQLR